jgi:hypothetical protein
MPAIALRTGLGEGIVVHIAGRDDLTETRHVVAGNDLGEIGGRASILSIEVNPWRSSCILRRI